jgi:hypothetical protein
MTNKLGFLVEWFLEYGPAQRYFNPRRQLPKEVLADLDQRRMTEGWAV